MKYTTKKQDDATLLFTVTITPEEYKADVDAATKRIANHMNIKGFRKGKAPVDVIKREAGEMAIMQEAIEPIVQKAFLDAIVKEEIETIGAPQINLEKLAPGNDIVFTAAIALLPSVKLTDVKKIKVSQKETEVSETTLTETMDSLRGMHAEEVEKDGPAEGTDKLLLDMDMKIDGVSVEGGQAKAHQVYLSEKHYIPGFNENVAGLKKGEEKTFTLDFPDDHYQQNLAGKKVDISVKVTGVFVRNLPEVTDEFAKKLGQDSAQALKDIVKSNLQTEADKKAEQSFEIEILDTLIEKSKFETLPQVLIDSEKQKVFHELMRDLEKHGVTPEQYLADLKKTEAELLEGFTEQATKRAQAALVSRAVAKEHDLSPSAEEITAELETLKAMYGDNEETLKALERSEVQETIAVQIQNRKVMAFLKETVSGKKKAAKKTKKAADKADKKEEALHGEDCGCDEHKA